MKTLLLLGAVGFVTLMPKPAVGQSLIVPDDTLGAERSQVTTVGDIERIAGGARRSQNLFHSFEEFNVSEGRGAIFESPLGLENIFSRVTGSNPSEIFGTLGVEGAANLFFLNPNGIVFSENASLDIQGSFVGSTGTSFNFADGSEFNAVSPESSLLTVSVPLGLQHGPSAPKATISNRGAIAVGQDLTLSAGVLDLEGQIVAGENLTLRAADLLRIRDSAAEPFVAASGGEMLVQGDRAVDIFALNHPESGLFSGEDMVLRSANAVGGDAHYWSGGNFRVERLTEDVGDLFSPKDPVIRALGDVAFNNHLGSSLHILAGGSVDVGTIFVTGVD
ncbi:MAG: filamentous hemagglutinin N-terminal domain-containing protein, partial [Cyanobacteria bacterium P01_A01_bin.135]